MGGITYQTAELDTGLETLATQSQGARKKVYTKGKQRGIRRRRSLRMTE